DRHDRQQRRGVRERTAARAAVLAAVRRASLGRHAALRAVESADHRPAHRVCVGGHSQGHGVLDAADQQFRGGCAQTLTKRPDMLRFAVPAAVVLLMLAGPAAVARAQTGTIRGKVTSAAGGPLAAVSVTVDATALRAITNDQGEYELRGVPTGASTVRARLLGYVAQAARVSVVAGDAVQQNFVMAQQAIALSPVSVGVGSHA